MLYNNNSASSVRFQRASVCLFSFAVLPRKGRLQVIAGTETPALTRGESGLTGVCRVVTPVVEVSRTVAKPACRCSRKEVFQPHLPVRLPCYDLAPVTSFTLGRSLRSRPSGTPGSHGLTGGVYKARERIHRAMADARLLANPASRSRVADSDPN